MEFKIKNRAMTIRPFENFVKEEPDNRDSSVKKLYNVPSNSVVRVLRQPAKHDNDTTAVRLPPEGIQVEPNDLLYFSHIDGMFSFCKNKDGEIVHPAADTLVEVLESVESGFHLLREFVCRAGYGKKGDEPYRKVPVSEISNGWLQGALDFERNRGGNPDHIRLLELETEYRRMNGIVIPDTKTYEEYMEPSNYAAEVPGVYRNEEPDEDPEKELATITRTEFPSLSRSQTKIYEDMMWLDAWIDVRANVLEFPTGEIRRISKAATDKIRKIEGMQEEDGFIKFQP